MRNYIEKERDMCRSVLPCARRKNAREMAATVKRHNRRSTHQVLHTWSLYDDPLEFEGFANNDTNRSSNYENTIRTVVLERRASDKVEPLIRWAERLIATKLKHLSGEEHRAYFKALLPDNLIGRHAYGHLEHLFPDENPHEYGHLLTRYNDFYYYMTVDERRARNQAIYEKRLDLLAQRALAATIKNGD